ncbi:MAG: GDSL family lipase, partial [Rhodanobacter sp.]
MKNVRLLQVLALASLSAATACAAAASPGKWVGTWAQSMTSDYHQLTSVDGAVTKEASGRTLVQAPSLHDATLRQVVLTSVGGERVRIHLSNYYGLKPLTITAATLALGAKNASDPSAIVAGSSHRLRFDGGKSSITLAPGQVLWSDPLPLRFAPLATLAISLYMAGPVELSDVHPMQNQRISFAVAGDQTQALALARKPLAKVTGAAAGNRLDGHLYVLDGVAVEVPQTTRGIVAFGDSITDGAYATAPSKPWPQVLA